MAGKHGHSAQKSRLSCEAYFPITNTAMFSAGRRRKVNVETGLFLAPRGRLPPSQPPMRRRVLNLKAARGGISLAITVFPCRYTISVTKWLEPLALRLITYGQR
jgi:hypothetical protein